MESGAQSLDSLSMFSDALDALHSSDEEAEVEPQNPTEVRCPLQEEKKRGGEVYDFFMHSLLYPLQNKTQPQGSLVNIFNRPSPTLNHTHTVWHLVPAASLPQLRHHTHLSRNVT